MITLQVVLREGAWRMLLGDRISRPFASEREAINAAIEHAQNIGRKGMECEVVMTTITCVYSDQGLIRARPTPRRRVNPEITLGKLGGDPG